MRILVLLLVFVIANSNARAERDATDRGEAVFIEHAEIIRGVDGNRDLAYLAIWNGTGSAKVISNISASGYAEIQVAHIKSGAILEESIEEEVLSIPSRSELVMSPNNLFIVMTSTQRPTLPVDIKVEFENGVVLSATAIERRSTSDLVHHDHGMTD